MGILLEVQKNVVNSVANVGESEYLVHYTEPRRDRFDLQTPESFNQIKDLLGAAKDSPDALGKLEINTGVKYDPHGLLWDAHLASIAKAVKIRTAPRTSGSPPCVILRNM